MFRAKFDHDGLLLLGGLLIFRLGVLLLFFARIERDFFGRREVRSWRPKGLRRLWTAGLGVWPRFEEQRRDQDQDDDAEIVHDFPVQILHGPDWIPARIHRILIRPF